MIGRYYFRVIEHPGDVWACRRGARELDRHDSRTAAVAHIRELASVHPPSEVILHTRDGGVRTIATFD